MKKILYIVGGIVLITLALLSLRSQLVEEVYFNSVQLSENNFILNGVETKYYDTILSVGLDQMGISGIQIQIQKLSNKAKAGFSGELKAHIKEYNDVYYLFIDNFNRKEAIEVIAHEIIHIQQYQSGQISYDHSTGILEWEGQPFDVEQLDYNLRPWELDAFNRQGRLESKISQVLY